MHEKNMRYGQFLRSKRISDSRELTLRDIAEELGVSVSFVSDVEQGRRKPYDEVKTQKLMEYMDWFQPAWEQLTEDERYVLEAFYSDVNCYGSNAAYYIATHFHIEQSSAYKRKNRALDRLTVLLFGKA